MQECHVIQAAYPLSRAGTNCPSRKAMTRAAPLLSRVPCCRRFFRNSDIRNRELVMPVTRPEQGRTEHDTALLSFHRQEN